MPQFAMHLKEWLSHGHQADMHYMEELTDMRANPQLLVEGAQSVVSLAVGYRPDKVMKGNSPVCLWGGLSHPYKENALPASGSHQRTLS